MTKTTKRLKLQQFGGDTARGITLSKVITNLWGWVPGDFLNLEFDDELKTITISKAIKEGK